MSRIRILPENLTNRIAAGEVVERPASVVKELVENALDAGCSEVTVEIESGGRKSIRVIDDGSGMSREDALLSLERHATSKISEDRDLFGIATLGFRGEAIPSIASVSRFTLATREPGSIEGTEIYSEGGKIKEVKACGMPPGTVITVRNLFFNMPPRLKFLKAQETEAGHVGDYLCRLAISRPGIRFTYRNDGREVFRVLEGNLADRVAALLGQKTAADLYRIDSSSGDAAVRGLLAPPELSRSSGSHIYTYINGRFIRDRVVQHAVLGAYRNFLEKGRYPVVVLFVEVPPDRVDVNVHPTKHEVRFRDQGVIHDFIQSALLSLLSGTPWIRKSVPGAAVPSVPAMRYPVAGADPAAGKIRQVQESLAVYAAGALGTASVRPFPPPVERPAAPQPATAVAEPSVPGFFGSLTVIGQFNAAYLLCQGQDSLVIIDQHAAHERIAYEELKSQFLSGGVESQGLLFPETLELSFSEKAVLDRQQEAVARMGFDLEPFGGSTWILKGVPRLLGGDGCAALLRNVLDEMAAIGKADSFEDACEAILSRIACHSVVRGSHSLTIQETVALLSRMDGTPFSTNCPHGRPVFRTITLQELEKMFKRA